MDGDFNKKTYQVCPYPKLNRRRYIPPPRSFISAPGCMSFSPNEKIDNLTCYRQAYCPKHEYRSNYLHELENEFLQGMKGGRLESFSNANGLEAASEKNSENQFENNPKHEFRNKSSEENNNHQYSNPNPDITMNGITNGLDQRTVDVLKNDMKNGFQNCPLQTKHSNKYNISDSRPNFVENNDFSNKQEDYAENKSKFNHSTNHNFDSVNRQHELHISSGPNTNHSVNRPSEYDREFPEHIKPVPVNGSKMDNYYFSEPDLNRNTHVIPNGYPNRYDIKYHNTNGMQARLATTPPRNCLLNDDESYNYLTSNRKHLRSFAPKRVPQCYHENLKQPKLPALETTEYKQHFVNYGRTDRARPIYPEDNLYSHSVCTAFAHCNKHNGYIFDY